MNHFSPEGQLQQRPETFTSPTPEGGTLHLVPSWRRGPEGSELLQQASPRPETREVASQGLRPVEPPTPPRDPDDTPPSGAAISPDALQKVVIPMTQTRTEPARGFLATAAARIGKIGSSVNALRNVDGSTCVRALQRKVAA